MDSSQPVKKNILHNERTTTDKLFLGIFTLTFLIWISIGSYGKIIITKFLILQNKLVQL